MKIKKCEEINEKTHSSKSSKKYNHPDIETAPIDYVIPIVGIGASAGGLEAIEKFFLNMPSDSGIAFVIIMHFDPTSKSVMVEIMKRYTKMEVQQATDGLKINPDSVYIIPPNKDLAVLHGTLQLL